MAVSGSAFDVSVQELADGFQLLRQEYLTLAIRHRKLDSQLRVTQEQFEKLADLVPEQAKSVKPKSCPFQHSTSDRLPTIEEALVDDCICGAGERSPMLETYKKADKAYGVVIARSAKDHTSGPKRLEPETEQMSPKPNQASCPFAAIGGPALPNNDQTHTQEESLPGLTKSRTKSSSRSVHDPLGVKSQGKRPVTPAESNASGPVCPIRFMDKHSPEDIANYFEEHKHELPRSHEICVKRFQSNAVSIRQLDEKYGNLVAMIQGLGQKHKPMLPDNPDNEISEDYGEGVRNNERIEAWSRDISIDTTAAEKAEADAKDVDVDDGGDNEDERIGRFGRPLKEIRVGESPSRPWGVPIPSKYLDRADDADSVSSAPKKAEEPLKSHEVRNAKDEPPRPQGKCPFDHVAMAAMANKAKAESEGKAAAQKPEMPSQPPMVNLPQPSTPQAPEQQNVDAVDEGANIVNHGIAIIAPSKLWRGAKITNHGTLYLANGAAHAGSMLQNIIHPAQ